MDTFGLVIIEERIIVLKNIEFPSNLYLLERLLGLIGYLRKYILYYSTLIKPL